MKRVSLKGGGGNRLGKDIGVTAKEKKKVAKGLKCRGGGQRGQGGGWVKDTGVPGGGGRKTSVQLRNGKKDKYFRGKKRGKKKACAEKNNNGARVKGEIAGAYDKEEGTGKGGGGAGGKISTL